MEADRTFLHIHPLYQLFTPKYFRQIDTEAILLIKLFKLECTPGTNQYRVIRVKFLA